MGGTGGASLHGGPASTCHRRALRSRAGPLGPLQGGWALSRPWLPWRTLDARLGRGGPRLSSSPVFGVRVSEHSCPVAPHPEGGLGGRSSCGPRWEPRSGSPADGQLGARPPDLCLRPGPRAPWRRPSLPFSLPLQTEFSPHSSRRAELGTHVPRTLLCFPGGGEFRGGVHGVAAPSLSRRQECAESHRGSVFERLQEQVETVHVSEAVSQKKTLLCRAWIRADDLLPSAVAAAPRWPGSQDDPARERVCPNRVPVLPECLKAALQVVRVSSSKSGISFAFL